MSTLFYARPRFYAGLWIFHARSRPSTQVSLSFPCRTIMLTKERTKKNSSRLRSLLVSETSSSPIGGVYPEVCRTITVHAASELSGMKELAPGGCIDPGHMRGGLLCLKDNEIGYVRGRRTDMRPGVNMVSSNRPFSTLYPLRHAPT